MLSNESNIFQPISSHSFLSAILIEIENEKKVLQESNWKSIELKIETAWKTFPFFLSLFTRFFICHYFLLFFYFLVVDINRKAATKGLPWFTDCAFFCLPSFHFSCHLTILFYLCNEKDFFWHQTRDRITPFCQSLISSS